MVPFAGWEMPVQFSGLIQEHKSVREHVGMFDISHMGFVRLEGLTPKMHCNSWCRAIFIASDPAKPVTRCC
ncbi:MAG: hypothetical protein CM15mP116_08670 [Synechococcus sp.]|nr:MAG: hypothetical protein CM15mP116_08670 [Synechococcus sp.]